MRTTRISGRPVWLARCLMPGVTLALAANAWSANFTVNSTADLADADPGNGVCEATADAGNCTLRAAIMESNALAGPHQVTLSAGTYTLALDGDDDTAQLGDLDIVSSEVSISGAGATTTILDANGIDRYFDVSAANVVLSDLTIRDGIAPGDASDGGAILMTSGLVDANELTLRRVQLLDNQAKRGGGVRVASQAVLVIEDSLLQGNATIDAGPGNFLGPAIYCQGCELTISTSTISHSGLDGGGAVTIEDNAQLDAVNSTLSANQGGGIRVSNAHARLKFVTLVDNGGSDLSFFSFDDSHVFEVGGSVLQSTTGFNCGSNDLPASLGYNVLSDDSCAFAAAGDLQDTDALLGALGNNGGPTPTHRPAGSSAAIDRVPLVACTGPGGEGLERDQAGSLRPAGDACDAGAVEEIVELLFHDGFETLALPETSP